MKKLICRLFGHKKPGKRMLHDTSGRIDGGGYRPEVTFFCHRCGEPHFTRKLTLHQAFKIGMELFDEKHKEVN